MKFIIIALSAFLACCAGRKGDVGPQGLQGEPGVVAEPCSVVQTETGATIACPDGTSATLVANDESPESPVQKCNKHGKCHLVFE